MRKITKLMSTLVLAAMLIVACAPEQPPTTDPSTETLAVPEVPTDILEFTPTVTLEAPAETATLSPTIETTLGVPVTGEEDPSRLFELLQFNVFDQNGDQIGAVLDMVVDFRNTRVAYVIVDTGAVAESDDKNVFVPWNLLQLQSDSGDTTGEDANTFVLQGDVENFNNAPDSDFETTVPDLGQPAEDWDAEIRNYWEGTGALTAEDTGTAETPAGEGDMVSLQGAVLATELIGSNVSIGALGDMNVGIEDVIINTDTGNIDYVVINALFDDVEHWIPIPLDVLALEANTNAFTLDEDIETLQDAPYFDPDQFPDTSQEEWDGLYSDFWNNPEEREESQ